MNKNVDAPMQPRQALHRTNEDKNLAKKYQTPLSLRIIQSGFKILGAVSPQLTGFIAYRMWITPPRFPVPKFEREITKDCRQHNLELNNHRIATYHWGYNGPKILLVHGWSGRGPQIATFVPKLLEMGYQVIAFDAPAHGASSEKQTNLLDIVATMMELEKRVGPFDAAITHSFGGPCVAEAMTQGFKARCVVNICPPANTIGLVDKFASILALSKRTRDSLVRHIENKFGEEIWEKVGMVENVRQLDVPALVIHDENDDDVPYKEGRQVAAAWKQSTFITTTDLGHRRILKDAAVIQSVSRFIAEHVKVHSMGKSAQKNQFDDIKLSA